MVDQRGTNYNPLTVLRRKIFLLIGRAILSSLTNSGKYQLIQVKGLDGETISDLERAQEYGFETYPKVSDNTEVFILSPNGNRDQSIAVCVFDNRYRPTDLSSGDVCLYNLNGKQRVWLKADGSTKITNKDEKSVLELKTDDSISIKAGSSTKVEISAGGSLEWVALASKIKQQIDGLIDVFNTHTHGGIYTGSSNTAVSGMPMTKPSQSSYQSQEVKVS